MTPRGIKHFVLIFFMILQEVPLSSGFDDSKIKSLYNYIHSETKGSKVLLFDPSASQIDDNIYATWTDSHFKSHQTALWIVPNNEHWNNSLAIQGHECLIASQQLLQTNFEVIEEIFVKMSRQTSFSAIFYGVSSNEEFLYQLSKLPLHIGSLFGVYAVAMGHIYTVPMTTKASGQDMNFIYYIKDDSVFEAYKIADNIPVQTNLIGQFEASKFIPTTDESIYERRKDLQGKLFIGAVVLEFYQTTHINDDGTFGGYFVDMFDLLSQTLNFTYEFKINQDNNYGSEYPNGSFGGMVGMLQRGEVDVVVADLTVTKTRMKACDFTTSIFEFDNMFLIKRPKLEVKFGNYLKVFSPIAWVMTIIFVIACVIFLWILLVTGKGGFYFSAIRSITFVATCFACKDVTSWDRNYLKASHRIMTYSILILGFVFFSMYNGILISSLTVKELRLPFNSIQEFLESDINLAIREGSFQVDAFRTGNNHIYKQIYDKKMIQKSGIFYQPEKGFHNEYQLGESKRRLLEDGYALVLGSIYVSQLKEYPCEVVSIEQTFLPSMSAFALPKGSHYVNIFNFHLYKMIERGIAKRLFDFYFGDVGHKDGNGDCNSDNGFQGLGLNTTVLAFTVIGIGILISTIILFIEKIFLK